MSNRVDLQALYNSAGEALRRSRSAEQAVAGMGQELTGMRGEMARMTQNAQQLMEALQRVEVTRSKGDPGIQRVEQIPGRRIPFDFLVDITIGDGITSTVQGSQPISQEGPFVAVCRYAALVSTFEFQFRDPATPAVVATFQGRSFGRYRPIHSAWDLNDGQPVSEVTQAVAFPGTGAPHVGSPSSCSPFRSMEGDFRILFENAGSSFPRSNIEVPSAFWTKAINEPFDLGALDVFERGEVLTWRVLPLHANNPPFGNLSGFGLPNAAFPFVEAGWDCVEGINDTNDIDAGTTDPVTRLANAVLTIGYHGYRIVQPAGAGPY
jgi:hypothetical protein